VNNIGYGVFLNIHPAATGKGVTIHAMPCAHFKQNPKRKGVYTFHKKCSSLDEAVGRASGWALEWHAPIKLCAHCVKAGRYS
jgi:hypothetical protein